MHIWRRAYWVVRWTLVRTQARITARIGGIGMSHAGKRSAAAIAGLLRKANPARGWRRYAIGGLVVAFGVSGAVAAVDALPAQAGHGLPAQAASTNRSFTMDGGRVKRYSGGGNRKSVSSRGTSASSFPSAPPPSLFSFSPDGLMRDS